jgi:hypothetical protein
MSILRPVNSKANIKQTSGSDIPANVSQNILNRYEADSSTSQTVINMSFSVDQSNKDAFLLHVDGKLLREGAANDYIFTNIASDNTSSQVTLTSALPAGLNIIAIKAGTKIEAELQTDTRFVAAYDYLDKAFQGFVSQNAQLTATTTTGTPATGYFYSSISNRSSIVDLTADLKARMGVERVPVPAMALLQTEFGPNGELVYTTANDTSNLVRFVGSGWANEISYSGVAPKTYISGDYLEITYYGTGLNLLMNASYAMNLTYQINGGTATSLTTTTYSNVLAPFVTDPSPGPTGRNSNTNQIISVVSGQTLGIYTVRINQNTTTAFKVYGFEVLNESSSVKTSGGTAYTQGKKITPASSVVAYNSGFTNVYGIAGSRGGHVLQYLDQSGNIKKDIQYVDTAPKGLSFSGTNSNGVWPGSAADHTNEEISRVYHYREFGAGRTADDFGSGTTGAIPATAAFTLEDGTATLSGTNLGLFADGIYSSATNGQISLTFVGTGVDISTPIGMTTVNSTYTISVDGASIATGQTGHVAGRTYKICSGLPYGTHTVKFLNTTASTAHLAIRQFTVYQPKKPTLPSGCIELSDYNIMADYVANATSGLETIATGVLRKDNIREAVYSGTWGAVINVNNVIGGWQILGNTAGAYIECTFFGTGFEFRGSTDSTRATAATVTLNGLPATTANFASLTSSVYGFTSFTSGTLNVSNASTVVGAGLSIRGLTLAKYTVRITIPTTANIVADCFDIITPIHAPKSNTSMEIQNSLPIGSCALSDNRKISAIKEFLPYQKSIAKKSMTSGITFNSATLIPFDAGLSMKVTSGRVKVSMVLTYTSGSTLTNIGVGLFIDGSPTIGDTTGYSGLGYIESSSSAGGSTIALATFTDVYTVAPGWHNFCLGVLTTGISCNTRYGNLIIEEI